MPCLASVPEYSGVMTMSTLPSTASRAFLTLLSMLDNFLFIFAVWIVVHHKSSYRGAWVRGESRRLTADLSLAIIEGGDGMVSSKCSRQAALRLPYQEDWGHLQMSHQQGLTLPHTRGRRESLAEGRCLRRGESTGGGCPFTGNPFSVTFFLGLTCSSFSILSSGTHSRSSPPPSSGRSSRSCRCCTCGLRSHAWSWGRWRAGNSGCWSALRTSGSWRAWGPPWPFSDSSHCMFICTHLATGTLFPTCLYSHLVPRCPCR